MLRPIESTWYGILDAVFMGMTDDSKTNERAITILRQWVIQDARGQEHPLSLYHPLTKDAALIARLPKPDHWREVAPGSVPPPKPARSRISTH